MCWLEQPLAFEGLGLVYLEAGSFGLPILVGSSGGAFETIIPGKNGFIVGSRQDIYDGVKYFNDNPNEIEQFGKQSKIFVEDNFSWEKTTNIFTSEILSHSQNEQHRSEESFQRTFWR